MENIIKQCLQDRTLGMFSEEWYIETSKYINEKVNPKDNNQRGYVYIIRSHATNEIKIGKTTNPQKRLNDIRMYVGNIHVIGIIESDSYSGIEKQMHDEFKEYRVRGEWFVFNDIEIVHKYILDKCGYIINKRFNNLTNILSDSFIYDNSKTKIPEDLVNYFHDIELHRNGEYTKSVVYENIPFDHNYSPKAVTLYMKSYVKSKGMRFEEKKSGNNRYIRVFF